MKTRVFGWELVKELALLASQDVSSITYSDDMHDIVAGGVAPGLAEVISIAVS